MTMTRSEPGIPAQAEAENVSEQKNFLNEKLFPNGWVFFYEILDLNEKLLNEKTISERWKGFSLRSWI